MYLAIVNSGWRSFLLYSGNHVYVKESNWRIKLVVNAWWSPIAPRQARALNVINFPVCAFVNMCDELCDHGKQNIRKIYVNFCKTVL